MMLQEAQERDQAKAQAQADWTYGFASQGTMLDSIPEDPRNGLRTS
jgi:hypothetical protein